MGDEELFVADWHEKEDAWPIVFNLGRIALEWSMLEQFFTALIWHLLGDHGIGMAVTGGMGNQSKADVVKGLAKQIFSDEQVLADFDFACKAFNILRENRNQLLHSHSIFPTFKGNVNWRRATGRGPSGHLTTVASFDDQEDMIASIVKLGMFTVDLVGVTHAKKESREFIARRERFPMPKPFKQLPVSPDS